MLVAIGFVVLLSACTHEPVFRLTVENGSGTGWYEAGERAEVSAYPVDGHRLVAWEGDVQHLKNAEGLNGEVNMPPDAVDLKPYLLPTGEYSFRYEVFPIIQAYCKFEGCHANANKLTNFDSYAEVESAWSKMEQYLILGFMPLNVDMPEPEKQVILQWIYQGRKNN